MTPEDLDFLRHLKKEENQNVALNLIKSFEDRKLGHLKKNVKAKEDLKVFAEEELVRKADYDEQRCDMPGMPRSTFLMVFSPDGTKVASTHGNHNIYVTDLRSGKNIKILIGHPRTPWCIAFHPTSNQIVASGCLGGQVRIWDLSGGSEVWTASNQSVIASLAFHPNDRVLVIATINELHFWDWSKPEPFCHTATGNQKEKVRYVAFDKLGHKLITGISNSQNRWDYVRTSVPVSRQSERPASPYRRRITPTVSTYPLITPRQASTSSSPREPLSSVPERERNITVCYRNLVREYGRLVQRYLQLYRPPAMIDRGTDPMEQVNSLRSNSGSVEQPEASTSTNNQPGPSTSNASTSEDSSAINPYQLLAPSRMLSPRMKPPPPVSSAQTSDARRKRVSRGKVDKNGKKLRLSTLPFDDSDDETTNSEQPDDQAGPSRTPPRRNSPQPSTSRADDTDREQILEDIIRGTTNDAAASASARLAAGSSNSSTSNDNNVEPCTSAAAAATAARDELRKTVMAILYKSPKVSKATQKYLPNSEASSSDDNRPTETEPTDTRADGGTAQSAAAVAMSDAASRPGTSRDDMDTSGPREAQRLEVMMMNIRRNAEEKLRSRFLPLIRSVPENDRRELIRLFEQGVKESREKARLRYRNMGQMFTKKPNRRPIFDTSTDSTSSEDEQNPLHMNFFNQSTAQNSSGGAAGESSATNEQGNAEAGTRGTYHDINNLENWVTSLFDDIEPTTDASATVATTQTTTTTTAPSTIDSLLDRPPRPNRVQNMRRIYARVIRDRTHTTITTTTSTVSTPVSTSSSSVSATGGANTRTTNSTIYSFARRRLGTHRASAFLPTRVYYPRTPPEFRRNRHLSFGRWRLNQRLYRSNNINPRPIPSPVLNNNSNFASDEVINFSERPNSEDDPVPTFDRRSSTPTPPHFPFQFHPFNPPPDLPTINPENIGIGNMYSNIVQDLETSLNDVRNIRAANRPGEMSDMLSNFSERLENIMNQSETILRNLRTSVEMLPASDLNEVGGEQGGSTPTVSFNDANFYVRDSSIDNILDGTPLTNVTSDHTYPRNSDVAAPPTTANDTMSPLMTSLHLTISHIQRQARLLRQQVESIERIDRAMVEVAQLQLMRLLLVELSRYVRNMSGESRSTCMSSVRQMMAGTRISDSSPGESAASNDDVQTPAAAAATPPQQPPPVQPSTSSSNLPPTRTRGLAHKTYPPSRLSRLQRQSYRRTTFINHAPRRLALRLQPRNAPGLLTPSSVPVGLDSQTVLNMYSRINVFTLGRMSRRLEELVNEQIRIFMQRSFVRVPPRTPGGNMGEQNLAIRLRDSITRTNRLVGNIFDANVVRNYRMDAAAVSRDGVDRFYARQTLSFIIDGISSHLDETRGTSLSYNIRLQLQGVMTMSMLLSELLLLHIVDSIPPPTDMNLDQERQSLTSRIDQMCTTMMLRGRYGGFSTHLTHTLRQLQTMMRQNANPPPLPNPLARRRASESRFRPVDVRPRSRSSNIFTRARNLIPTRAQERNDPQDVGSPPNSDAAGERTALENRIISLRRMRNSLHSLCYRIDNNRASLNTENRGTQDTTTSATSRPNEGDEQQQQQQQAGENLELRARAWEARSRAIQRMQMMDRMRNSLRTLRNRFGEPEQGHNSESDDNTRQSGNGQRSQAQPNAEPSTAYSGWREVRYVSHTHPTSGDRSSEPNRYVTPSPIHDNFPTIGLRNISPYRPTPALSNLNASTSASNSEDWTASSSRWSWSNVPSVQVNDVPVSELGAASQDGPNTSSESDNAPSVGNNNNSYPNYDGRAVMARLAAFRAVNHPLGVFRPRFLHPLYASVNPFDADLDDPQREHIYDSDVITTVTPNHRIQVWDISDSSVPVISNPLKNVVVSECKIHNDASVDVASDGSILVTLLPSGGYLNVTNRLGVYSLKWETLGQCLYTTNFDHNAVSVSLSPLARHLVVGLASRRVSIVPSERWMMARIFRIEQKDIPGDRLPVVRELEQSRDGRATSHKSVNCIRWLPTSGQGLIYATNTGQLVIWT